jgi:hypothetical protein
MSIIKDVTLLSVSARGGFANSINRSSIARVKILTYEAAMTYSSACLACGKQVHEFNVIVSLCQEAEQMGKSRVSVQTATLDIS